MAGRQEGSIPRDPGCVQSGCQRDLPDSRGRRPGRAQSGRLAPPAAAVNTGALHADRDRHSRGRGRVGWKGLRQRGLSGKPLRHLYLTESPEGSRTEARPDFRLTRGSWLRAASIRDAAKPSSSQDHLAGVLGAEQSVPKAWAGDDN